MTDASSVFGLDGIIDEVEVTVYTHKTVNNSTVNNSTVLGLLESTTARSRKGTTKGTTKEIRPTVASSSTARTRLKLAATSSLFTSSLLAGSTKRHGPKKVSAGFSDSFNEHDRGGSERFHRVEHRVEKEDDCSTFSVEQFIVTFVSESLPVLFGASVIILWKVATTKSLKEGFRKGWNCNGHRTLLPLRAYSASASKPDGTAPSATDIAGYYLLQLLLFSFHSFLTIIIFLFYRYPSEILAAGIDRLEFFFVVGTIMLRNLVIAIKYGYFKQSHLDRMDEGPDSWSPKKSEKEMLLTGWCGLPRG